MKSPIAKIVLLVLFTIGTEKVMAQVTTDPLLTAAVVANKETISKEIEKTNRLQTATLAENTAINALLVDIHEYEVKMHTYLSKAQNVVTSAVGIMRALKMSKEIVEGLIECSQAAVDHPMGTLVSTMVSESYSTIAEEALALAGYITTIVQGGGDKNLLNTAERIRILNSVNASLYRLSNSVWVLKCNIKYMGLRDLFAKLTPELYYKYWDCKFAYDNTVRQIGYLKREMNSLFK